MKKNVAVIYGGYSSEYEISVSSGRYIASIIDDKLFNVYEINISKEKWVEVKSNTLVDLNDFSILIDNTKIKFGIVVNVIHGNPGENGILQSYFDLLKIKYIGCNSFISALTFNKYYCNNYLRNFDVKIPESILLTKNDNNKQLLVDFIENYGLPVFVKPSSGGSSFGTTKVKNLSDIDNAVNNAFIEADEVLVEKFISGRELTCGLVKLGKQVKSFTPLEIVSKHEFFDYESKYNSNLNQEIIPAPVEDKLLKEIRQKSEYIYQKLNCSGIVRVDYILHQDELYFLEINTIPGMTSESIVPKMMKYDKINIKDLFTKLIEESMN